MDRLDNSIGHTIINVVPCCLYCNRVKKDLEDKEEINMFILQIKLRQYCLQNNLPMTITDERVYHHLRKAVTGGIANVLHRKILLVKLR